MMIDAVIICRFCSVIVCLCFLEKKQGSDHPPAVSPSVFFFFYIYLVGGVPDRPFGCTDNLIFKGNLSRVQ